jgi:hypothetical protein
MNTAYRNANFPWRANTKFSMSIGTIFSGSWTPLIEWRGEADCVTRSIVSA